MSPIRSRYDAPMAPAIINLGERKFTVADLDDLPEDAKSDQLRDFSEVIGLALEDPKSLLDYRQGCKRLADAIIAVDSVTYKNLFSQNITESELLTTVLGQAFYYLPANPDGGILVQLAVTDQDSS